MKRRRFVKALAALPAAPALVSQQQPPAAQTPPAAQAPAGRGGAGGRFAQGNIPKFELTSPDSVSEPTQRFLTQPQFAALRKLSAVLLPPMGGNPGALDCGVPEFLDFLIGASPAD